MDMLSKNELLKHLRNDPPLVEGLIDESVQVQPNGIEMTLQSVDKITTPGAVAFDNSERVISDCTPMPFDEDGWLHLEKGIYKIKFNEIVNIPTDIAALAKPRSSLIRCGATLETAVWDAGYSGRSESMMVVYNDDGFRIKKDARVMQLLFYNLTSGVAEGYNGIYQNENK
ncbi:MAG: deoxyuridine 5'-triphosphate nucleotidohydrolase [Methanosarcinales archaeon]|nr:deoxyuridine 5'-triphosphate nucleotidohydrolase [Methanosarcinales archaeon]